MVGTGPRFTYSQREILKQLILESDVQRFTLEETKAYIRSRMGGLDISDKTLCVYKASIRNSISTQLKQMREHKTMFINELFFKRRDELNKYHKELWRIYHLNANDSRLQADCIKEMHKITVTLCQIYSELPAISGMSFFAQGGINENGGTDIQRIISRIPYSRQSEQKRANGDSVDGHDNGVDDGRDSYKPVV